MEILSFLPFLESIDEIKPKYILFSVVLLVAILPALTHLLTYLKQFIVVRRIKGLSGSLPFLGDALKIQQDESNSFTFLL
jgi:hypothetical protein